MSLAILGGAVLLNSLAVALRPKAGRLRFSVSPQMGMAPLDVYQVAAQSFTIKKLAYTGTFSDLVYPSYFLTGQKFPIGGLIKGKYTNTSPVPLEIRIRVIDATRIVCEEAVTNIRAPGTTWDFWLPTPGPTENVYMPDKDWNLTLELLGYW